MLLLIIATPVMVLGHSLLQAYAPSNILVRRARSSRPTFRRATTLGALSLVCVSAVHLISVAPETGAPGWLDIVVLVLAWDAIKYGLAATVVFVAALAAAGRGWGGRSDVAR